MNKLIDVVCPQGHITVDAWWVDGQMPACVCGQPTVRAWLVAPGITPQGTRPERAVAESRRPPGVNTKAIAEATQFEIEQKWQRYSDPHIAEQHISREINEAAGVADAAGNPLPVPTPPPITKTMMERANV